MEIKVDNETLERVQNYKKKKAEIKENITKERLLEICFEMHKWIFLHCSDEDEIYDEIGLTDEENMLFGYSGKLTLKEKGE